MTQEVPEVTDAEIAYGTTKALPPYDSLPKDYRDERKPSSAAIQRIFFNGGNLADYGFTLKEGLDSAKVHRAIRAHLTSWAPKHEHKIAGVAYLIDQWFNYSRPKAKK